MSRIARVTGGGATPILLALILGGITFAGVMVWLPSLSTGAAEPGVQTMSVVVASDNLAAGEQLNEGSVRIVQIPEASIPAGALTSRADAEGRVLRYPVSAGEQLLASKLVGEESSASTGLAFVIPEGMRAVSVPVSEVTSAGGLIVPGDRVDVLAAVEADRLAGQSSATEGDVAVRSRATGIITVLQGALVLAVGQAVTDPPSASRDIGAQRMDDAAPAPTAASVTIAVTPEQAQRLFMAISEGTIGLALRPFGDTSDVTVRPIVEFTTDDPAEVVTR